MIAHVSSRKNYENMCEEGAYKYRPLSNFTIQDDVIYDSVVLIMYLNNKAIFSTQLNEHKVH